VSTLTELLDKYLSTEVRLASQHFKKSHDYFQRNKAYQEATQAAKDKLNKMSTWDALNELSFYEED